MRRDQGSIWWWVRMTVLIVVVGQSAYGQAVPGRSAAVSNMADVLHRSGPLPDSRYQLSNSYSQLTILQDSLKLHLLDIDIARAELRVSETNVWHRLIPEVCITANVGVQQLVFIDPTTFTPYMLPKDSYRLTLSLSLSSIFNMTEHDNAILSLESLKVQYLLLQTQQRIDRQLQDLKLESLITEQHLVEEELRLTTEILRYTQLLFDQDKTDFDNLQKAKLQLLTVMKTLNSIQLKQNEQ